MRSASGPSRPLPRLAVAVVLLGALAVAAPADAATITASYAVGYRDVVINGYGASGLGTFTLTDDAGQERLALCVEASSSHSRVPGAYRRVPNRIDAPALDYLLWRYGDPSTAAHVPLGGDRDTATALAALAWFYAGAQRRGGGAVWADLAAGGAAISPTTPWSWAALPPMSNARPVGLRAGGFELEAAERRVHDLHLEAEAKRGPWTMSPPVVDDGSATVTVAGPGGPIGDIDGVRFVATAVDGAVVANVVTRTAADGTARVDGLALPDGGTVTVEMWAPGVHEEWDGDGEVQRMATATSVRLAASTTVPPAPRHIHLAKRSTDPTIGVAGGEFELLDATGAVVERRASGADGLVAFAPIDPVRSPGPYRVREVVAPPGLAVAPAVEVPPPYSTDPAAPTVVTMTDEPRARPLVVRKVLSDERVGPADRSGFAFDVERVADGRPMGSVVTGPDGRTPPLEVTVGTFRVCEQAVPAWAEGLVDGGCVDVVVGDDAAVVEVAYVNAVPAPRLSSAARDPVDGDRELPDTGGRIVDAVSYEGLVPGTPYVVRGEVWALPADGEPSPTGVTGTTRFVPDSPSGTVEVVFEVPAGLLDTGVVFERLHLEPGDGPGDVVATHEDPADAAQTFRLVPPTTDPTTSVPPTTGAPPTTPPPTTPPPTEPTRPTVPASSTPRRLPETGRTRAGQLADAAVAVFTVGILLAILVELRRTPGGTAG